MTTRGSKKDATTSAGNTSRSHTPDDFPDELRGDFDEIPPQLAANIGTIAGIAVGGGGYFGLSVTDDGGSARLAIRHKSFDLDRRFYGIGKLEAALAYCLRKLRDGS